MEHTLIHFAPFEPGDHPGKHPPKGTPRAEGLRSVLVDYGLLNPGGGTVRHAFSMHHGTLPLGYIWRVSWRDPEN